MTNTMTKVSLGEEKVCLPYTSGSQAVLEEGQGGNWKAGLLAVPHGITQGLTSQLRSAAGTMENT